MKLHNFILGLIVSFWSLIASAQVYPAKPVHFIVPFSAGASIDILTRIVLDDIARRTNAVFVVEYKPGALGQIGMDLVAKASPDGYTLMPSSSATHSSGPQLTKLKGPDPITAFTHLASINKFDLMLVVNTTSGIKEPDQLIALAKTRKLNFGYGSATGQVGASAVARAAGIADLVVGVAYKSQPLAVTDLIGGHIDFVAADIPAVSANIRSGKLISLGVTADKRSVLFPEIPTLSERGIKLELIGWVGFSGPAKLPAEVRNWWANQIGLSMADSAVQEKMKSMGMEPMFVAGAAFQKMVADQYNIWGQHIREAGMVPQ